MYEDFFDYVDEYSDGKITFEVAYSNAIAPATEVDDAIRDGRLDMGSILPVYEPDQYPANAALADTSFYGTQAPAVAPLQVHGLFNEIAWNTPQVAEELEASGMKVLLPWYSGDSGGVLCPDARATKDELKGAQIVATGRVNALEIEGVGGTPVSLDYTELFESLQRGTVDCSLNSLRVAVLQGLIPVASNFTIDEEVGLAKSPGAMAINADLWASLPLVAQQVLFDGTKVMLQTNIEGATQFQVDGLSALVGEGGSVTSFDQAARDGLLAAHEEALDQVADSDKLDDGQSLVDSIESGAAAWEQRVVDLGFPTDVAFADFAEWHAANGYDLTEYAEVVFTEAMLDHRPS